MALQIAKRTTKRKRVISEMPSISFNLASCILAVLSSPVAFTSESERKERKRSGKVWLCSASFSGGIRITMQASLHCTLPSTFLLCKGQGYRRFLWTKTLNFFFTFPLHSNLGGADPRSIFQDHRSLWVCCRHTASKWQNLVSNPGDQILKHASAFLLV